jgi:hypothetical protein
MTEAAAVSHSDLRRLNLDAISCLIDALARLEPKASVAARRGVLELLCRLEWVYRGGEGALSTGARKRLQNAVIEGYMKEVRAPATKKGRGSGETGTQSERGQGRGPWSPILGAPSESPNH